jgi:hypothetical protein
VIAATLLTAVPQVAPQHPGETQILWWWFKYTDIITMLVAVVFALVCNEVRRVHVLWLGVGLGLWWVFRGFFPL